MTLLILISVAALTITDDKPSERFRQEAPKALEALEKACAHLEVLGRETIYQGTAGLPDG